MSEEKSKLIPFSKELEEAIEADAKRCERSFVRQVVAVLKAYYNVDNVELRKDKLESLGNRSPKTNQPSLQMIGEIMPKSNTSIPILKNNKKKKAG